MVCVCSVVSDSATPWTVAHQLLCPWNFPGKNTGVGCHFLLQGSSLTQGSKPGLLSLLHWKVDSLPLAPPGNPQTGMNQTLKKVQMVKCILCIVVVRLLSHVQLLATPWTTACQASLSFTNFLSLLKLMSIESVTVYNHLILCHPFLLLPSIFPSIRVFFNKLAIPMGGRSTGASASASASVLPMNIQG